MLLFAVFNNDLPATQWPLRHAHLLRPDEIVVPGDVRFDRGLIRCECRGDQTYALQLQFPVENYPPAGRVFAPPAAPPATTAQVPPVAPLGTAEAAASSADGEYSLLTLRTALLPQRTTPYLLSLELARHRLMLILNKLEEWAFFDLPTTDPLMKLVDETRQAFTWALLLQKTGAGAAGAWYSLESEKAARQALAVGLHASEMLAARQAQVQHARRATGDLARLAAVAVPANALTDHEARASRAASIGTPGVLLPDAPKVGVAVNPALFTPDLQNLVQGGAGVDFLSVPMRWIDMEPTEGKYQFSKADRWIEWAVTKAKLPVHAGPIIDLRPGVVPEFLYIWEHDYDTLRDVVFEHVKNIVTRYRRAVSTWTVCSSMPTGALFSLTPEQAVDLTRACVVIVRKLAPAAKVVVEVAQPFGEYTAGKPGGGPVASRGAIPPVHYAELLNQLALNVDALGVRLQVGQHLPGRSTRDLMAVSALLDRLAALDRPVAVTAVGCPSRVPPAPPPSLSEAAAAEAAASSGAQVIEPHAGHWRGPWSPANQAAWLKAAVGMIAGKPFVQSICWQDLYDVEAGAEMPAGAVASVTGQAKPALDALRALRVALRDKAALPI